MKYSIAVTYTDGNTETIRGRCRSFLLIAGNDSSLAIRSDGTAVEIIWLLLEAFKAVLSDTARVIDAAAAADFEFGASDGDTPRRVSEAENFVFAFQGHDGAFSCLVSSDRKMAAFMLEMGRANIVGKLLEDTGTASRPEAPVPVPPARWQ